MSTSFEDVGIEIKLKKDDDFLKVRETLTRIGIASRKDKKLFQSCHILHKQGRYKILHFKEFFSLDGKPTNFSSDDESRRNAITNLLYEWELVDIVDPAKFCLLPQIPISQIKILPFKEKSEWELVAKYNVGRKK